MISHHALQIYHTFSRFRLTRRAANYWFLYEGTPGGTFGATVDYTVRSNGLRTRADLPWAGDLPDPEWVYFGDQGMRRILFIAHHEDDAQPDIYRQMEGNMTVFGFGRDNVPCCPRFLNAVPQDFTIGFAEDSSFAAASAAIANAYRGVSVTLAAPEVWPVENPVARRGSAQLQGGELPTEHLLRQNFPNPFNPTTMIQYDLPEPSEISLIVYDLLGRTVAILARGVHEAGRHEVRFDASGLSSGVYVYQLRAGTFIQTRRLLLLR